MVILVVNMNNLALYTHILKQCFPWSDKKFTLLFWRPLPVFPGLLWLLLTNLTELLQALNSPRSSSPHRSKMTSFVVQVQQKGWVWISPVRPSGTKKTKQKTFTSYLNNIYRLTGVSYLDMPWTVHSAIKCLCIMVCLCFFFLIDWIISNGGK